MSNLSALPCFLGFFWMLWEPRKRTWHDIVADSLVVRTTYYPPGEFGRPARREGPLGGVERPRRAVLFARSIHWTSTVAWVRADEFSPMNSACVEARVERTEAWRAMLVVLLVDPAASGQPNVEYPENTSA
jgi:hypothetical protein